MIFCLTFSLGLEPQVYKSGRVETLDPGHGGDAKPAFVREFNNMKSGNFGSFLCDLTQATTT